MKILTVLTGVMIAAAACACGGNRSDQEETNSDIDDKAKEANMAIELTSTAFGESELIPSKYTCDGEDVSPPLAWDNVPPGTNSLAIICDDPDAPGKTWVHWVLFNIPPEATRLPEGIANAEILNNRARHGVNDFGNFGYGGPCPPSGSHRYVFKIFALDSKLDLTGKVSKQQLESAMQGHILGGGQLIGVYSREK